MKVYGVFAFEGLEDSDLAGALNVIDLVSFRELYGQMNEASRKELADMRQQIGIKDVDAANAEEALFGESAAPAVETRTEATEAPSDKPIEVKPVISESFDPADIAHGLAINAAVVLKNHDTLASTMKELASAFEAKGMNLQVIDWQAASGIVGQFVNIVRLALVFSLVIIFIVALVIINNTIIVGTLNRIREIGTMRAIGAQKSFVVGLFLAETGLTGLFGALLGTVLATLAVGIMSKSGLPAGNDVVSFLFSGPRLYPHLRWGLVVVAPFVVTLISTAASIYAARHAARVKPAEAMQEKE
jgi:ABC-type antimicrobial peptide transport system permease subunit